MSNLTIGRRGALALGAGITAAAAAGSQAQAAPEGRRKKKNPKAGKLRFGSDGRFTVLQFNDTQDGHLTDKRTIELITKAIEREKPNFVVFNGDIINGSPASALQVKQAYNNVIAPVEAAKVPWALTFGNHDEDSLKKSGMTETKIMNFLLGYEHNMNVRDDSVNGHANLMLPIAGRRGRGTAAALWLLDSGRYEEETLDGQKVEEYTYETLHADQVAWYREQSMELAKRNGGRPVPGLMWMHIPVWETRFMWYGSPTDWTDESHAKALVKHQITDPQRNEREYVSQFNSGIYNTVREQGDVMGIYFGHDHINTYEGNYFGVHLGYAPGTGYGTYGLDGDKKHHLRGCRVFTLDERKPGEFTTRNLYAKDLGIDVKTVAEVRISEPAPLPF
ncbi:metallophosphoesterase family protein [Luteococcus sp. H138]|uniref:metallophosphoesterase family protein n=1 Tax=unclassified Luteococcus TaxID=2639923 RepID=UPI00313D96B9